MLSNCMCTHGTAVVHKIDLRILFVFMLNTQAHTRVARIKYCNADPYPYVFSLHRVHMIYDASAPSTSIGAAAEELFLGSFFGA